MTTATQKTRGHAKREFIANLEQINALLEQKHTLRHVYDTLVDEGKITMKYTAFTYICRKCGSKP